MIILDLFHVLLTAYDGLFDQFHSSLFAPLLKDLFEAKHVYR